MHYYFCYIWIWNFCYILFIWNIRLFFIKHTSYSHSNTTGLDWSVYENSLFIQSTCIFRRRYIPSRTSYDVRRTVAYAIHRMQDIARCLSYGIQRTLLISNRYLPASFACHFINVPRRHRCVRVLLDIVRYSYRALGDTS